MKFELLIKSTVNGFLLQMLRSSVVEITWCLHTKTYSKGRVVLERTQIIPIFGRTRKKIGKNFRSSDFCTKAVKCPAVGTKIEVKCLLYIMNHVRPVTKRDNSCTLKAPDLAILEFEI